MCTVFIWQLNYVRSYETQIILMTFERVSASCAASVGWHSNVKWYFFGF